MHQTTIERSFIDSCFESSLLKLALYKKLKVRGFFRKLFFPYSTVDQEIGYVIKNLETYKDLKIVNPGMYYVNPISESFDNVDI